MGWYLDFKSRFIAKDSETQLYEREFYDELYQLIKSNGSHFYLILGNPGIGKSCFGMYLVYRFIQEHKEIIYHSDTGLVYWFRLDAVHAYNQNISAKQLDITVAITDNPDIIYITDGNIQPEAVSLPLDGKGGSVIAVASTQCIQKNLHEYKKQALSHTYYVPRYGLEELEELFCVHSNPYGYKLEEMKLRFEYLGGWSFLCGYFTFDTDL